MQTIGLLSSISSKDLTLLGLLIALTVMLAIIHVYVLKVKYSKPTAWVISLVVFALIATVGIKNFFISESIIKELTQTESTQTGSNQSGSNQPGSTQPDPNILLLTLNDNTKLVISLDEITALKENPNKTDKWKTMLYYKDATAQHPYYQLKDDINDILAMIPETAKSKIDIAKQ